MTNKTFFLPDLGEGLPDAEIVEWLAKVGDTVMLDQPLVSMETAKAVVEVPSPFSGKLLRTAGGPGDVITTGAWLVEMDLPDPERVLADPASFRLPERGDRAYAALAAIAAAVAADPTPARWTAGWQVLGLVADTAPDVAAVAARVLARCRPGDADPPAEIRLFAPVLRDAGLL